MIPQMIIEPCKSEQTLKLISDGLIDYNLSNVPGIIPEKWIPFNFSSRNENQEITGGILSILGYWGGLEVRGLWVKHEYRKQGIGTKLLTLAEEEAKKRGATISLLETFDFQAPDFYIKNGYTICAEQKEFPPGHSRFFLEKKLI